MAQQQIKIKSRTPLTRVIVRQLVKRNTRDRR